MTDPNPQQDYVAQLWALHRANVQSSVASGSLRRMIVDSVEPDGKVVVREVGTGDVHDEPYLALASPSPYVAGDYVIVGEVMGRGLDTGSTRVVLGKAGINSASVISVADSQATSSTPTTSSTATYADAITVTVALPAGTWAVAAEGSLLMSHNVSQASWRIEIDGNASSPHTLSMVTEERFAAAHRVASVTGGRTIAVKVQFRSFTAGTTSARNPMLSVTAVRQ